MALQIRRGTNTERLTITPNQGELIYTTDTKTLYVGDGTTPGGRIVSSGGGGGGATALSELTDVVIDTPLLGEVLTWDGADWVNAAPEAGVTYTISAESTTGGAFIRLTGSDASMDSVKLTEGANITITRTDANTISIAATGGGGGGASNLNDLGDVAISGTPDNNALLKYNQVDGQWINTTANLIELGDVFIGTPGQGSVLKYNYTIGHWEDGHTDLGDLGDVIVMATPDPGMLLRYDHILDTWTNGYTNIQELSDFQLSGTVLDGQIIKFNQTSGKWENSSDIGPRALNDLTDVNFTTVYNGDALVFDGTEWVGAHMPAIVNDLTDIDINNPQPGQVLTYDNLTNTWVNGAGTIAIVNDSYPMLGGNLDLNGSEINGTGSIDITGNVSAIEFYGHFNGDILGDVNGNLFGNVTGVVIGTAGSTITGTLNGPSFGDHTGTSRGNILSAFNGAVLLDSSTSTATLTGVTLYGTHVGLVRAFPPITNRLTPPLYGQAWPGVESVLRLDAFVNSYIDHTFSDGTVGALARPAVGSIVGGVRHKIWNGTNFQNATGVFTRYDSIATDTSDQGLPGSSLILKANSTAGAAIFAVFDSTGTLSAPTLGAGDGSAANPSIVFTTDGSVDSGFFHPGDGIVCTAINAQEKVRVDSGGMRVTGFMKVGGYATGSLPSPAEAGMIVLDTDTSQFKGYNGTAWVVLG